MKNLQIGSGNVRLPGFLNVDIRPVAEADIVGHAGDLQGVDDGTVDVLFSHALLEHIFLGQQLLVLKEWRRAVAPGGIVICLGLPDFAEVARLYVQRGSGIVGDRFDLLNVYRYTHGAPEQACPPFWPEWHPLRDPDRGPPGWLPQLHKGLFDRGYVCGLLGQSGLRGEVFSYCYPGEEHPVCLGFIASRDDGDSEPLDVVAALQRVPGVGRFVNMATLAIGRTASNGDGLLACAGELASTAPRPLLARSLARLSSVARRLGVTRSA